MSFVAILLWAAAQPVAACPDPSTVLSGDQSITIGGERYSRLNAARLRKEIPGHWATDPTRMPGQAYRFRDAIRFDRAGVFEDFDDRGDEPGRYEITKKGIRLIGGMRDRPELMVFFGSRKRRIMTGIDRGQRCIRLAPKILKPTGR